MAKALLQLVRLPNLFTAAADSLAGWWIVAGGLDRPELWLPLVLASVAIYAGGIALNDYVDRAIDAEERPNRPIPSGRVGARFALFLAVGLLGLGWALTVVPALLGGDPGPVVVGGLLVSCVVGYNTVAKPTRMAPIVMGSCRSLNLLLGMSLAADRGGRVGAVAAVAYGTFVAGVTFLSRSEMTTGRRAGLSLGLALESLGLAGLVAAAIGAGWSRRDFLVFGLIVLGSVAIVVARSGGRAWREATPQATQSAVKAGIFSLVWVVAALVASAQGPGPAVSVAILWIPAFFLGKWLYAT